MRMAAFLFAVLGFSGAVRAEEPAPKNVILFGWDGAQREQVTQALVLGELPTLTGIVRRGTWVEIEIEGAADTKAGWAQILTGHKPEVTGVFSNRKHRPIPKGLTIFERLPKDYLTLAITGKKGHRAAPHVFLATNDNRVCRGGLRQDVAATIYDALGLDPTAFDPPLDGTSLAKQLRQPRTKRARAKKAGP